MSLWLFRRLYSYQLKVSIVNGSIRSDTENISMPVLYVKNEVTQIHLITVKTTKKSSNKLVLMSLKTNDITCRLPFIIKDCDGTSCLYFFLKEIWNVSCKW